MFGDGKKGVMQGQMHDALGFRGVMWSPGALVHKFSGLVNAGVFGDGVVFMSHIT